LNMASPSLIDAIFRSVQQDTRSTRRFQAE
jgi:hypothetical protein